MTIAGAWPSSTPMSPSLAGITTMSTGRDSSSFSGLTISRFTGMRARSICHGRAEPASVGRWPSVRCPAMTSADQRYAVAFRLSAFFTASSIVPTM